MENYFNNMRKAAQALQTHVSNTVKDITDNVLTPLQERLRAQRALAASMRERKAQMQQHLAALKQLAQEADARGKMEESLRDTIARTHSVVAVAQEMPHCRGLGVIQPHQQAQPAPPVEQSRQDMAPQQQRQQQQSAASQAKRLSSSAAMPPPPNPQMERPNAKRPRLQESTQQQQQQVQQPQPQRQQTGTPEQAAAKSAPQQAATSPARSIGLNAINPAPAARGNTVSTPVKSARKTSLVSLPRNLANK